MTLPEAGSEERNQLIAVTHEDRAKSPESIAYKKAANALVPIVDRLVALGYYLDFGRRRQEREVQKTLRVLRRAVEELEAQAAHLVGERKRERDVRAPLDAERRELRRRFPKRKL